MSLLSLYRLEVYGHLCFKSFNIIIIITTTKTVVFSLPIQQWTRIGCLFYLPLHFITAFYLNLLFRSPLLMSSVSSAKRKLVANVIFPRITNNILKNKVIKRWLLQNVKSDYINNNYKNVTIDKYEMIKNKLLLPGFFKWRIETVYCFFIRRLRTP